jgi:hypothetical protein
VRISGAGRLTDFRERLRWLMVREIEAEWEHDGARGRAVIEKGRLVERSP